MSDAKQGPLSIQDLLGVWQNAVDRSYQEPLQAAGEGKGFEAYTQMLAQFARVSTAIDVTTQALFVRPWSGQTSPPAGGAQRATVQLTFSARGYIDRPIRLAAGTVYVDEQVNDWGDQGSTPVATGRRYLLTQDAVFFPGDTGPLTVGAQAEFAGYGYNNPRPGTISLVDQPGSGYYHDRGTVVVAGGNFPPPPSASITLTTPNEPETFIPAHVGQYVQFTSGANAGKIARVTSFAGAQPALNVGSAVALENLAVLLTNAGLQAFAPGEQVVLKKTMGTVVTGYGTFVAGRLVNGQNLYMIVVTATGASFGGGTIDTLTDTMVGVVSGASAAITGLPFNIAFVSESPPVPATINSGAVWRVLDWKVDIGLVVSNTASPQGGVSAMLDAIGAERNVPRATGEQDGSYRERVASVADTTSPNAVRRALTRVLGSVPYCFREVGTAALPGIYYDRTNDPAGDYYDPDCITLQNLLTVTGTQPAFNEVVQYRNAAGDVLMTGWLGNTPLSPMQNALVIRKGGRGTLTQPLVYAAGDTLYCTVSGCVVTLSDPGGTHAYTQLGNLKPNAVYLDYATFRGYFRVGVPRLGYGEFGFAFGALPAGSPNDLHAAYDSSPLSTFYDGYPLNAAALYRQVYAAVDKVRAGGVLFDLYREDGTCS